MKKIILLIIPLILVIIGVTYAFFNYSKTGEKNEYITGQIYMNYTENSQIYLIDMLPETKEEALARTEGGIFNFTVEGRNTSKYPIYYGISLVEGEIPEGKTVKLSPEHIMIYLERDGEVLIDGIRYSNWNDQRIWVETIDAVTSSNITHEYELRMWIDTGVRVSDTDPNADYTTEEWNNAYASLKVGVDGMMETMNMPLFIETSDTYVENNNAYFIAKISNFYDMNELGRSASDEMNLRITGTNSDIVFSYKDSEGNVVEETSETLDLTYIFNKNKTVEVQVFVKPKNDANGITDLNFQLTKNGEVVQNFNKYMNIYGNNFCLNNGLNKLYDCILASDSLVTDVETAKVNIANKGEVNLNDTAPTYTYVEEETLDVENVYEYSGNKFYFGNSYKLNKNTGKFELCNVDGTSVISDYLSDDYKEYYTSGPINMSYKSVDTIYKIKSTSVSEQTYTITLGDKITSKVSSSIKSEVGLYKTEDDYGNSYFYRGDVSNNNVYFGGYYWKIMRTNGDNSIRLIYNGQTENSTSVYSGINNKWYQYGVTYPLENSPLGVRIVDPTYVGYMYGKNFALQTSEVGRYSTFKAATNYYFADGYEFDEENEVFRLKKNSLEPVVMTISEISGIDETTGKKIYELYPYTCQSTSFDDACEIILKVNSIVNETSADVQYISYSSIDKDSTRTNELSSNAKNVIEKWYVDNIVNKKDENNNLITDYIVDGTFCNNRSIVHATYNSGYLLNKYTIYSLNSRFSGTDVEKQAVLKCSDDIRDKFSNTSDKGNGLLAYPIALPTADEVWLAGGKNNTKNIDFYLNAGSYFWTMTPSSYSSENAYSTIYHVYSDGSIYGWSHAGYNFSLRPVINIRSDVLLSSGDGTVENPFQLTLS